ncbi:hypothetical protein HMPREF2826_00540 [Olsenella sp. HMSC062G07]|nr:hypothetical protein HMPREF2826_00540 [Olsenella sp. HMSC062G07]
MLHKKMADVIFFGCKRNRFAIYGNFFCSIIEFDTTKHKRCGSFLFLRTGGTEPLVSAQCTTYACQ